MAGLFQDFDPLLRMTKAESTGSSGLITAGSLISFQYPRSMGMIPNVIHDPHPMVILTDVFPPHFIRGVNLHYLTFRYVKHILESYGGNTGFTYLNIKPDKYLAQAFRMYKLAGVIRPKRLDTEWLKHVLASVQSFNPGEIEKIRLNIQQQIQQRLQAKAKELTSYDQWRKSLNKTQQSALRYRTNEVQDMLTRGQQQNLIMPELDNVQPTGGMNPSPDPNDNIQ